MRTGGVKLVLITGARLSTMLTRMAFLPAADAYVCENGGRIYYPEATLTVALPIAEDMEWRRKHNATGINHAVQLLIATCDVAVHAALEFSIHALGIVCLLSISSNYHEHTDRLVEQSGRLFAMTCLPVRVTLCHLLPHHVVLHFSSCEHDNRLAKQHELNFCADLSFQSEQASAHSPPIMYASVLDVQRGHLTLMPFHPLRGPAACGSCIGTSLHRAGLWTPSPTPPTSGWPAGHTANCKGCFPACCTCNTLNACARNVRPSCWLVWVTSYSH